MDAEAGSNARVLVLIRQAQVVNEFLGGSRTAQAQVTERVVDYVRSELRRLQGRETDITTCESLLCDTVIEAPFREHYPYVAGRHLSERSWPPKKEEAPVVTALKGLVFGIHNSDETFTRVMCSQTYEKAGVAFRACVLVLEDTLRPKTCFQILRVAASTGIQRLYARSAAMALLHFQQAILQDPTGLQGLPREVLGSLLSHDYLQADETGVFSAVGLWVMGQEKGRLQYLYPLFVQCVRLGIMSMKQLHEMDSHPLMPKCPKAMKLVAFGYLAVCYGCNVPGELSGIVNRGRRQRIAINPAALSFLRKEGVEITGQEQPFQQHRDLFRLSPALSGGLNEATPASHATLHQLQAGFGSTSSSPGLPPPADSAEGLRHAVWKFLTTERHVQLSSSGSRPSEHDYEQLSLSNPSISGEIYDDMDSARWRRAVAPAPAQHESGCKSGYIDNTCRSDMHAERLRDSMAACSMDCDARGCISRVDESVPCSAAQYADQPPIVAIRRGIWGEGSSSDFDMFSTSPSSKQKRKRIGKERGRVEAHASACRQVPETGKPLHDMPGPQRRLF